MLKTSSFIILFLLFCCQPFQLEARNYLSHQLKNNQLTLQTDEGKISITFIAAQAVEVFFQPPNRKQLPSFALLPNIKSTASQSVKLEITNNDDSLLFSSPQLTVKITKQSLQLSYYKNGQLLSREDSGLFVHDSIRGVRFKLDKNEKILGGGERVLGMNRRGQRMPLYNRAHYGYTMHSNQMNYSLPIIMSSKKYMILFDNSAKGFLDIGKSEQNILQFEAVAGRSAYVFVAGDSYPNLINNYVDVTGHQPMPPRWALGNFASRFGYHSEQEARNVVAQFKQADIPLDAIIFDLYWFGKDLKGYMGYLDWDKKAFPTPIKMIADFKQQGVKTIVITEPFILTNVDKWQDAADNHALALDLAGKPKKYDFYFGNTSLVDVFSTQGQDWFWQYYAKLLQQGVAGWWGDLGEPEVHPADTMHAIGSSDEIHNAYGHKWAEMIFTKQLQLLPNKRPFLLMRSGFAGSQRFGMIPWTGDVERSWGGLKPQVELSLQMGLFGLAYTHSDLGGFAGDLNDEELYVRWLQYGVFQPIYRPHAQESVPSEPIFHSKKTQKIIRQYIKLRYQLLPYNYTLAYQNSLTGIPLMRPLFFNGSALNKKAFSETNSDLIDIKDSYFWGDAFFVSPITDSVKTLAKQKIYLPKGVWFNYFDDSKYQGNQNLIKAYNIKQIPVFVRAGSFIPMIAPIQNTEEYTSKNLMIHYYADQSVKQAHYQMYEDDGKTYHARQKELFELLTFNSEQSHQKLQVTFNRSIHKAYKNMPKQRVITFVVHHYVEKPHKVVLNHRELVAVDSLINLNKRPSGHYFDQNKQQLTVKFKWQHTVQNLIIN